MAKRPAGNSSNSRREILGILIMAFAVLIFLGLVSHNHTDYPNSGSPEGIRNWLGLAGSTISHYLFTYTIGYPSLVFPFLIFLLGWNVFLQQNLLSFLRFSLFTLGMAVFLATALAMPEALSEGGHTMKFIYSGNFGGFLATQLSTFLGAAGSVVVLLTCLLVILISATSWSMREAVVGFKDQLAGIGEFLKKQQQKLSAASADRRAARERKTSLQQPRRRPAEPVWTVPPQPRPAPPERVPDRTPERPPAAVEPPPAPAPRPGAQAGTDTAASPSQPGTPRRPVAYRLPPLDILDPAGDREITYDRKELETKAAFLEERLKEFDIRGHVVGVRPGPVITRFEVRPAPGVKISKFVNLQDDIALVMQAQRVRVVAPIPGKAAVGIELPNKTPAMVTLRGTLESQAYAGIDSKLPLALGQTIEGRPYVTDLKDMPHLLVAGATGAGKSVCLNTIIASILFRARPDEVRFILIDPKKLELSIYKRLRSHHLITRQGLNEHVITTVDNAISVLRSLEKEMERRYRILARVSVRNLEDYHELIARRKEQAGGEEGLPEPLPYIVLIVDELADLMMTGAREVEEPIARLAQMSRAVGIHLILATQRPSVDVITGVIKANFPARIAFQVTQKNDSRTILDRNGAEKLLGRGDMLFMSPREAEPIRIHGAFISTDEVKRMVAYVAAQPTSEQEDLQQVETASSSGGGGRGGGGEGERDELFKEAARLVIRHQQGSASLLQRRLRIGYARAGRLIDELEDLNIIGPFEGSKAREVLVDDDFLELLDDPRFPDNVKTEAEDAS
ncbi:DNA translocase FtsK 4TM domain-containing protein [bacterium]|nr:DNA translocase FtsK 4TM domain-containing protein [bacterium]